MFINIWIVNAFTIGGINHFCMWIFIFIGKKKSWWPYICVTWQDNNTDMTDLTCHQHFVHCEEQDSSGNRQSSFWCHHVSSQLLAPAAPNPQHSTASGATKISSLKSPPSRRDWPQPVQPRSPYQSTAWERIRAGAHRDQLKALNMKSLPLLWYLTLHLHIHIFRTPVFASCLCKIEGHRHSWCVFTKVLCHWISQNQPHKMAQTGRVCSNEKNILTQNQNRHSDQNSWAFLQITTKMSGILKLVSYK